jgi:restriction system protein
VAKRQGLWAEIQRERARQQRIRQWEYREIRRAEALAAKAERESKRRAAANERERKKLYVEDRKAEAAAMAEDVRARVAELDGLLKAGIRDRPLVTFPTLRRTDTYPPFDAGQLDQPSQMPIWEDFAPEPPSGIGKIFGGGGRFERQVDSARAAYAQAVEQHTAAEASRRQQLAVQRSAHDAAAAEFAAAVAEHNAGIDQFQRDCRAGDPEAVAEFCTLVMDSSVYPEEFPHTTRAVYRPDPKEAVIEWELPRQSVIPVDRGYRYVASRDAIDPLPRAEKEIKDRYRTIIAQVALRTIHEILISTPGSVIDQVTFYGYVPTTDPTTGQPIRPLLLQVTAAREVFSSYILAELDPVACLHRLNALVSPHPYDLEPVKPTVDFESLLTRFKFVAGMDVVAGLDSRPDLLAMAPYEFEHLVRQIFEEMGMQAWNTQAIKDDGVDAVAVNNDAVFGGMCIIQAKRYRHAVGVEAVRALAGVMEDMHATKGILVTTSWVTKDGHAFATRHGRIEIMEGEHVKYLCKEHLGLDVLISLPKPPPRLPQPECGRSGRRHAGICTQVLDILGRAEG